MRFKKKTWLAVVIVAIPLAYLLLISFIPEDRIAGFHWSRRFEVETFPQRLLFRLSPNRAKIDESAYEHP